MRKVSILTIVGLVAALALVPVVQAEVGNAPDANDSNRVVGVDGGNIFLNGVVPGGSIASVANLEGLVSVSGAGATGALIATVATADGTIVDDSGLTPAIGDDGAYSVETSADFSGAYIVSFGDASGNGASLVVASAAASDVSALQVIPAGALALADVAEADGVITVTASTDQGALVVAGAVAAEGVVTISLDYESTSDALNLAVIGFDGALGGTTASYSNPTGGNLAAGATKNLSVTINTTAGSVLPAFQVYNTGADAVVTISNVQVISAGPATDYAAGAADLELAALNTWGGDLNTIAGAAPVADGDGVALNASTVAAVNASTMTALTAGEVTAEAVFSSANVADGAFFVLMVTDGAITTIGNFVPASAGSAVAGGSISVDTTAFVVVQAAGFDAVVSEVVVSQIADGTAFDPNLLGG